nr:transposase [Streptomyces triculaminicus]
MATASDRIRDFAAMMTNREGHRLQEWIAATEATELAPLRGFARNLRKDLDAVTAGLTLEWNSGPVEGHVNRIKMLKRQMFGRAKLDLLRLRILLNTSRG